MKTYLFDFDGTLVDSMPTFVSVMLRILDEYHVSYGDDVIKTITPMGYAGAAQHFVTLGVPMTQEQVMELMGRRIYEEYLYRIPAKEYVADVLGQLRAGGCSLNILTASPHTILDPCLKRLGLHELFDHIWSCDDFNTSKADPDIYVRAAEQMGVPVNEVLFLDDNLNACKTAKRAGMRVCGVFDESSRDYMEDMKQETDHYIMDFRSLPEIQ
ncbi:MAG: HAD family phosphatase [Oscillospiraceae bacterium]|nr:HAD family phosphatase [Oscillospiraceae bacterium]